jgi:hypothetical protein
VSQTIGKVINGDEADITKLRGTSHSTPKKPEDYTKNVDTVNNINIPFVDYYSVYCL